MSAHTYSRTPELLSPAGDWDCARAAVASGADAIYFGLPKFNARMRAKNFTEDDLPELMSYLHRYGVKGYVAMNTLIFADELESAAAQLRLMAEAEVDGVIVQDLGLAKLVNETAPSIELHASTQMTLTSPEGLEFASRVFSLDRAVLARELSLNELKKFKPSEVVPIEVFVHGALCVAYSGQCLTSESLGQRSANRGECAQACRMPYDLIIDGVEKEMAEVKYLLSPQDLAAVDLIPELVEMGIVSYKIEGRLKSPEYVAAVTKVYRRAIDDAAAGNEAQASEDERYRLEMTFSRGMTNGWLSGTNHPSLTHGKWGKKRGPFVGEIIDIDYVKERITLSERTGTPINSGDGFVIDEGQESGDRDYEQGGVAWQVSGNAITFDRRAQLDWRRIKVGQQVYKTSDPALAKQIESEWRSARPVETGVEENALDITVCGQVGEPISLSAKGVTVESQDLIQKAEKRPLTIESLKQQLGKLGGTSYSLNSVKSELPSDAMLPLSSINRVRRALIDALEKNALTAKPRGRSYHEVISDYPEITSEAGTSQNGASSLETAQLRTLCRELPQIEAAVEAEIPIIYADFEDLRLYKDAVQVTKGTSSEIVLATPRIQKAGESGYFKLIERNEPDGVLIRNLGAIEFFQKTGLKKYGDFSLNVANPLTASLLKSEGDFESLTVSYDLNYDQANALLRSLPPAWFEVCIHQHMPLFHMEHCVFCAFMSEGTSYKDCGRPCEKHKVQLRDRVGQLHTLAADVGCRNTLFNGRAQTAASYVEQFRESGVSQFRIELLSETKEEARTLISSYQSLVNGKTLASQLLPSLSAIEKLGVTEGTLEKRRQEVHRTR